MFAKRHLVPLFALLFSQISAQIAIPYTSDCFTGNNSLKLNVTTVYAQVATSKSLGRHLSLVVLGQSPQVIQGTSNGSSDLATLFSTTEVLTFNVRNNNSYFCTTLRPPSPLPAPDNTSGLYCPIPAGAFAFSSYAPLTTSHELSTLQTQLRAVDPFSNELLCIDIATTPLDPGAVGSVYGRAKIIFWASIALSAAYWFLVAAARLSSAWSRRSGWSGRGFWSRIENIGFVVASAVSGEGLSKSPALIRFVTPSMRDVFFHTQWCATLAMVAVQWPEFIYPILSQTAWATLSYNVTLTQGTDSSWKHWNPVSTPAFDPPSDFADQLSDKNSAIFIDSSVPNTLFTLPQNATSGISSFAYTVGLRPQDLFPVCLVLFLAIVAGTTALSLFLWALDSAVTYIVNTRFSGRQGAPYGRRSPHYSAGKDVLDGLPQITEEDRSHSSHFLFRSSKHTQGSRKSWFRIRPDFSSFHFSILQGNLVRVLMLFHLPVTIFSCYQMSLGRHQTSVLSIALAALSFALFSVIIPILLIIRLFVTSTSKLYDETWTLLALGPLYNHYRHGSQLFACMFFATSLAIGITIGCGQRSGTAQAIIILIIEVASALVTSVWLPWGHGASMGLLSFLFCVTRIVVAVLLVILSPTVSIGSQAGQWVAYVILFTLSFVYLAFVLLLFWKIIEALTRIFGRIGFDRSHHTVDSGLIGVCGLLGCCGTSRGRRRTRSHATHSDLPPITSQVTLPLAARQNSTPTQSGPPSIFRPEHALRPYREDNDHDTGFIMGAWRPFPRPGYSSVGDNGPDSPGKGFSRVGGGRSHFDAPYSIATGSVHTFPNSHESDPSVTPSLTYAERQLPPGAMAPHVRKKSQTAIIEHAPVPPRILPIPISDDDASEVNQPTKRRHWFQLRKPRRHSYGDEARPADVAPADQPEDTGRSFVVVRNRKMSQPMAGESGTSGTSDTPPAKSFVVLRNKDNSPG
ncbi:hypothetical protein EI94DRAFT_1779451 [Lactarius quietus]|nr:hypothetical protein EI94DRAFT_1779451 [Lactarius quietus]